MRSCGEPSAVHSLHLLRYRYGAVPNFDLGRLLLNKHGAKEEDGDASEAKTAEKYVPKGGRRGAGGSKESESEPLRRTNSELSNLVKDSGESMQEPTMRPESEPLEVIEYDDLEMGDMIGGGGFALVYRCR